MDLGVMVDLGDETMLAAEELAAFARFAEEAGCESIWVPDHVVLPERPATPYPYSTRGTVNPSTALPDPLVMLGWLAAVTGRLRLATGVLVLSQRQALVVAKQAATADALSGGRVLLGIGVGWQAEEMEALGVPFAERGARTEEAIAVVRAAWAGRDVSYTGRFQRFEGMDCFPRPRQPAGVPIVVGGGSAAAARRAGRLGDGYYPIGAGADHLGGLLAEMGAAAREVGRDPASIPVTYRAGRDAAECRRLAEMGVSRVVVRVRGEDLASLRDSLAAYLDDVFSVAGG
jgi:probable F420-dependent oxidoreductase